MAEDKKKSSGILGGVKKTAAVVFTTALGLGTVAACQQQGEEFITFNHGYSDSSQEEKPEIGDEVTIREGALIYNSPDDAILGINGKTPNIDSTAQITISKTACQGPNGEFSIEMSSYSEQYRTSQGYQRAAIQITVNGEVAGYFKPSDVKEKQKSR